MSVQPRHHGNQWTKTHTLEERLLARVDKTDTCWLWAGFLNHAGYGLIGTGSRLSNDRRHVMVHRAAYELWTDKKIPQGWHVDHLCRVRNCVNPEHLEAVTPAVNSKRAAPYMQATWEAKSKARRECSRGHDLTVHGKPRKGTKNGWVCNACQRQLYRERYREKKLAKAATRRDSSVT